MKLDTLQKAYKKGAKAASSNYKTVCPYGHTKQEFAHWWHSGYNDYKKWSHKF